MWETIYAEMCGRKRNKMVYSGSSVRLICVDSELFLKSH